MFNDYKLMNLAKDRVKSEEQRILKAMIYKEIDAGKPDFKSRVCERLAGLLLRVGQKLTVLAKALTTAQDNPSVNLPDENSKEWHLLLENRTPDGYFI
jgi:hypothetical protein